MTKRIPTTKDIGLLKQLFDQGQLQLAPEYQRNSVWTRPAKAYLIDTILNDRPIPLLYFQRASSAQTGRPEYHVIDGQQRLRAILEFLDNRFPLVDSKSSEFKGKKYNELSPKLQERILSYDLYIQELSGYLEPDLRDIFVRMNKYVVKLSAQEIRHAHLQGKFADFVEEVGTWAFWRRHRVFTPRQLDRMRAVEFAAELAILILEGPQDKKKAIDLYYLQFQKRFSEKHVVKSRIQSYLDWIVTALPGLATSRFKKPVDLYSLIGALERVTSEGSRLHSLNPRLAGAALQQFERSTRAKEPRGRVARYLAAASRQTDNIRPRNTRIQIISTVLSEA